MKKIIATVLAMVMALALSPTRFRPHYPDALRWINLPMPGVKSRMNVDPIT